MAKTNATRLLQLALVIGIAVICVTGFIGIVFGQPLLGVVYAGMGAVVALLTQRVAQRKKEQEDLRRLNETLEQRVLARTSELDATNQELEAFSYTVSHDLRNPLGAITGYAEMVLEEVGSLPPSASEPWTRVAEEVTDCTGRIRETSKRMAEMVQNLLDANRIERGEMQLRLAPIDLAAAVAAVLETQRPRAAVKQQTLHWQNEAGPVSVPADATVLAQVIENLVSNAVKYSPTGKNIYVRLGRSPEGMRCEVRDEGPGLSAEDQKKLFGKFARLSAKPTGGEHSTGLGLSIVKKMVEAMNGKVWCESEPGKGATFIVEFPATRTGSHKREAGRPVHRHRTRQAPRPAARIAPQDGLGRSDAYTLVLFLRRG